MQPDPEKDGRTLEQPWVKGVRCLLVPISAIDHTVSFALESTHVVWVPLSLGNVRKEDEIRLGGRKTAGGKRTSDRYVVKGIRRFLTFGERSIACYVQERE